MPDLDNLLGVGGGIGGGSFEEIAFLEGLRKRAECRRLQLAVRSFIRGAARTNLFLNIDALDDLYEEYKAETADGPFKRLANRSRSRRAFRVHYREFLKVLRDLLGEFFDECVATPAEPPAPW